MGRVELTTMTGFFLSVLTLNFRYFRSADFSAPNLAKIDVGASLILSCFASLRLVNKIGIIPLKGSPRLE